MKEKSNQDVGNKHCQKTLHYPHTVSQIQFHQNPNHSWFKVEKKLHYAYYLTN